LLVGHNVISGTIGEALITICLGSPQFVQLDGAAQPFVGRASNACEG
jgi:hypothetical protein